MKNINEKKWTKQLTNKFKKFFSKEGLKTFIIGGTIGRRMFRLYFLILIIFAILLYLPISFQPFVDNGWDENFFYQNNEYVMYLVDGTKVRFDFFDSLFMSFSAFTDTGLSLFNLDLVFSDFGKVILMFVIQIGGFGIMFFIFLFWKIFKRSDKLSVNQTLLAQYEKGNTKVGNTAVMLITSSLFVIFLEIIFAFYYSLWFLYVPSYEQISIENAQQIPVFIDNINQYNEVYMNPSKAFFAGFFHSVSVVNNAGFDILGSTSLSAFKNGIHTLFLIITAIQFIIGGIGFPVIFDIFTKFKVTKERVVKVKKDKKVKRSKIIIRYNRIHKLSLFSKLTLTTYFIIAAVGIIFIFIFEVTPIGGENRLLWTDEYEIFGPQNSTIANYNKSISLIFQSLSTRSAGYATFDNSLLSTLSKWLNIVLMFVGGSASSTAGGIRVTTLAIILIVIYKKIRGNKRVSIFKRNLDENDIMNSFMVFVVSVLLVCIGGIVLFSDVEHSNDGAFDSNSSFTNAIFMCTSAFGTTGLSTVGLQELNWWSQLYLMFLMFIGQYGVSTTILAMRRSKIKENLFNYTTESVRIG